MLVLMFVRFRSDKKTFLKSSMCLTDCNTSPVFRISPCQNKGIFTCIVLNKIIKVTVYSKCHKQETAKKKSESLCTVLGSSDLLHCTWRDLGGDRWYTRFAYLTYILHTARISYVLCKVWFKQPRLSGKIKGNRI